MRGYCGHEAFACVAEAHWTLLESVFHEKHVFEVRFRVPSFEQLRNCKFQAVAHGRIWEPDITNIEEIYLDDFDRFI